MAGFGDRLHLAVEQTLQGREGRVAPRQVVEARIAGVAAIAVRAAPAAARPVLFREQAAALLEAVEQVGVADVGFVKMGGEERENGQDGRESTANEQEQGRREWSRSEARRDGKECDSKGEYQREG